MNIIDFAQNNGVNAIIWLFAMIGVFKVFGKQLGQALVKFARLGEKQVIDAIPSTEIQNNAKLLIKQAEQWMASADGKAKMDWVVGEICKGFPVIEAVVRPIAQAAYDEIKVQLGK